jgi:hypothetical protein
MTDTLLVPIDTATVEILLSNLRTASFRLENEGFHEFEAVDEIVAAIENEITAATKPKLSDNYGHKVNPV